MQVEIFGMQLASLISDVLDEHAGLTNDGSISDSRNLNVDNEKQHNDTGVPVTQNYHPHLDVEFIIVYF